MAFFNSFALKTTLLLAIHAAAVLAAIPNGTCLIQGQALVCQDIDSEDIELVSDYLLKMATEHPFFGVAFYNSKLDGFPEDIFEAYNITTFAHVAERMKLKEFPITSLLMSLRSPVTHLYLVSTAVHSSDLQQFKELPFRDSLRLMDLRYNDIAAIEDEVFAQFPHLEELNLENNIITQISKHTFEGLGLLKKLSLSATFVKILEAETFAGLPSLEHLDLSRSDLINISENAFANLENLQTLDLSMNKLTSLEKGVFNDKDLPKLTEIRLSANPFFCECELQWFKLWLTERGLLTNSGAKCITGRLAIKQFEFVDFCPDLDDDEIVLKETVPENKKQDDEEVEEEEEDDEDFIDEEVDDEDEEDDDDWDFKEEL